MNPGNLGSSRPSTRGNRAALTAEDTKVRSQNTFCQAILNAAAVRTHQTATRFGLSIADREDLYQALVLDLLERARLFEPSKGSAHTFAAVVAKHRAIDFLKRLKKDRARAVNRADGGDGAVPLWTQDHDLFTDSQVLLDLQTALAYLSDEQWALFALLENHGDLPGASRVATLSSATFYRRVNALRMHLRMFGLRSSA